MPSNSISSLARRLELIEATLERAGFFDDFQIPDRPPWVDPVPPDWGRWGGSVPKFLRRPPIGDPPPLDWRRIDDIVRYRLTDILRRNPGWITDPPPEDFLNVRVLDLLRRYRGGFTDPAPDDIANIRLKDLIQRIPGGGFTDPPPTDIPNLSVAELETQLHRVNAELVRLNSVKRNISDRLGEIQKPRKAKGD